MKLAPIFLVALLPLQACASIVTGSTDTVRISSSPSGADFRTNTGHQGTTPAEITIPDTVALTVTVSAPGHETTTTTLSSRMSGWFAGNLLLGGIIGGAIDLISGNWRTHDDELMIAMPPVAAGK